MTRFGMGQAEMERIAELMKEVVIDQKDVREEVRRFRSDYPEVEYGYDDTKAEPMPARLTSVNSSSGDA